MTSSMPIYAAREPTYQMTMLGLSTSEFAIVVFILLLVIVAGRLPRWWEALGSYLYKRGKPAGSEDEAQVAPDGSASRTPARNGSSSDMPPR
jgi:Sec-independent protein translocase protein TatA